MRVPHYYVAVWFFIHLFLFSPIAFHFWHNMALNLNVSSDVTMESLVSEIQTLRAELTALQSRELSLDERGRERSQPMAQQSRPHNTKIIHFANLPGENFLAWRSQFQVIATYHRWSDEEAKHLAYAYMRGLALESVMDISITGPETLKEILDEYQKRFIPPSDSQLLRAQFNCVVQLPNESVQKLHARMRVLYHLAYPDKNTRDETHLIERFINALNNREVQNYVRRRKPTTYGSALHIANEETSFILMDLATHAPGGIQAPLPGDHSFIASMRARRPETGKSSGTRRKCYYCDEEGHYKERCPTRLKDFLRQRADKGQKRTVRPSSSAGNRMARAASPAARRKQVKFAEASQTFPVVNESYGKGRVAAINEEATLSDNPEDQDLLDGVDLTTLDEATVAVLYEELQQPDDDGEDSHFPEGQ